MGTLDKDSLLDSMTPEQFSEWAAYNEVEPLNHCHRMLGLIAYLLGGYLGVKMPGEHTFEELCMPWAGREEDSFAGIAKSLPIRQE